MERKYLKTSYRIKTITSTVPSDIIQESNRAAEEKGYDYYGIQEITTGEGDAATTTIKCYGFKRVI